MAMSLDVRRQSGRTLRRETGESLYLLALTAGVSAAAVGLGLLAVWLG